MPHGKMTATDDEIRAMLAEGYSALHTSKTLHCGLSRVRRVRDGKEAQRSQCDRDRIFDWCDGHELGELTPGQRAAAIVEALGVSETTARRWEYAWRTERGDVAPMPSTGGKRPDTGNVADAGEGEGEERDTRPLRPIVEPVTGCPPAPDAYVGEAVSVPRHYLEALEAVVILAHLLNDARAT